MHLLIQGGILCLLAGIVIFVALGKGIDAFPLLSAVAQPIGPLLVAFWLTAVPLGVFARTTHDLSKLPAPLESIESVRASSNMKNTWSRIAHQGPANITDRALLKKISMLTYIVTTIYVVACAYYVHIEYQ